MELLTTFKTAKNRQNEKGAPKYFLLWRATFSQKVLSQSGGALLWIFEYMENWSKISILTGPFFISELIV